MVTFAEIHTRTLCVEMYPKLITAQPDFYSRCFYDILCLQKFPNLYILVVFFPIQFPPGIPKISTQVPGPLFLETFHPASTRYSMHIKLGRLSTSKAVVLQQTYSCMYLNIYIFQNTSPHQPIISGRGKFLAPNLWPCWTTHVGCWVHHWGVQRSSLSARGFRACTVASETCGRYYKYSPNFSTKTATSNKNDMSGCAEI